MSFQYSNINTKALTPELIQLLEQIDSFGYTVLQPRYHNIGELHNTLSVEVRGRLNDRNYIERISISDIKAQIKELEKENERIYKHNENIRNMSRSNRDANWETKLITYDYSPEISMYEDILKKNSNQPDDYVVEIEWTHHVSGFYTRQMKNAKVVMELDYYYPDEKLFVTTYIHEMMHAYYDSFRLSASPNVVEYVEEPLAEYGMLHFLREFVKANPQQKYLLEYAIEKVKNKQFGLYHYAFGECLYQNYSDIEWEKLMLDAKNKVNVNSTEYKSLQPILQTRPNKNNQDKAAQLLYDILTNANGMASKSIVTKAKNVYGTIEEQIMTEDILPILESQIEPILEQKKRGMIFEVEYEPGKQFGVTLVNRIRITHPVAATNPKKVYPNPKAELVVEFPDDTVFDDDKTVDTFVKTIEKIGFDKVAKVGIMCNRRGRKFNLVDTSPDLEPQFQKNIGKYYVYTNSSTGDKVWNLIKIISYYNLDVKIIGR